MCDIKITMLVYCENSSNQINLWCRGVICPPVCLLMDYYSTTPAYKDLYRVDIGLAFSSLWLHLKIGAY